MRQAKVERIADDILMQFPKGTRRGPSRGRLGGTYGAIRTAVEASGVKEKLFPIAPETP